jgi:hypothetical protein
MQNVVRLGYLKKEAAPLQHGLPSCHEALAAEQPEAKLLLIPADALVEIGRSDRSRTRTRLGVGRRQRRNRQPETGENQLPCKEDLPQALPPDRKIDCPALT